MRKIKIFSGTSNPSLATGVAGLLGVPLAQCSIKKSPTGESDIEIHESVRDQDVYIVQSGCGDVNNALMELCIMVMACKMAASRRVVAVLPHYFYSKQSKRKEKRRGIPAKLAADMLKIAGATQVVCLDLHASQIQGFFDIPCDNLNAVPFFVKYIRENVPEFEDAVVLAKNAGGAKRAVSIANKLKIGFALIHKEFHDQHLLDELDRDHIEPEEDCEDDQSHDSEDYGLIGSVKDKNVIIIDDMMETASSFVQAAKIVKKCGGKKVYVMITHGIFTPDALDRITDSPIHKVVTTNSVPQAENMERCPKLTVIDISPLLTEAIRRIHHGESLSFLGSNVPF